MEGKLGMKRWKIEQEEEVEVTVEQGGRGGRYSKEEEVESRAGRKRRMIEQGGRGGR